VFTLQTSPQLDFYPFFNQFDLKMKHNNDISLEIRQENSEYNVRWISSEGMVGERTVSKDELDVEEHVKLDASPFMVVWLKNIDRLCSRLPDDFDFGKYTLIDVGCGSGISTIYFHMKYPFKYLKGFDFSTSLVEAAEKNKQNLLSRGVSVESISYEVGDAKRYRLPQEPLVMFMFNPFGWETMKVFIENNIDALRKTNSLLLYANDIYVNDIANYGKILSRDDYYNLSVVEFGR
jgi:SAM-dependent methyltransferase